MKKFNKILQWIVLIFAIAWLAYYFMNQRRVYDREKTPETTQQVAVEESQMLERQDQSIEQLTAENVVVEYVREHGKLPDYYITKSDAGKQGWEASKGNLCDILPGRAIGGDRFGNRERQLPDKKGRQYFEADLNYNCGNRGADRLIFSNDGLIFVTRDHYKTFIQK
ncbi:MAG: hypothetical protein LBE91_01025 [Tannerella sp.]|nr:hypothetical protein [Tannerella sp.]